MADIKKLEELKPLLEQHIGRPCTIEYPGFIYVNGKRPGEGWSVGDANGDWGADLTTHAGEHIISFDCDRTEHETLEKVADVLYRLMREYELEREAELG